MRQHREGQRFTQDHPLSPSFDPLVLVTGSDGHFPIRCVTNITGTMSSKLLFPFSTHCHHLPVARTQSVFCKKAVMTLGEFSLHLILVPYLTQEDQLSTYKINPL